MPNQLRPYVFHYESSTGTISEKFHVNLTEIEEKNMEETMSRLMDKMPEHYSRIVGRKLYIEGEIK